MRSCFETMNLIREPVLAAAGLKATGRQAPDGQVPTAGETAKPPRAVATLYAAALGVDS
jgi:hypothetical protein